MKRGSGFSKVSLLDNNREPAVQLIIMEI